MNTMMIKPTMCSFLLLALTSTGWAQSSFAGLFLYHTPPGAEAIGGNLLLTFSGDRVFFESTLRDYWVNSASVVSRK